MMPNPPEQEEWKKIPATQVDQIQRSHPDCDVQLWAMDGVEPDSNAAITGGAW